MYTVVDGVVTLLEYLTNENS